MADVKGMTAARWLALAAMMMGLAGCEAPADRIFSQGVELTNDPCVVSLAWEKKGDGFFASPRRIQARLDTPDCRRAAHLPLSEGEEFKRQPGRTGRKGGLDAEPKGRPK